MAVRAGPAAIAPSVSCFRDTCNVYVLRSGREAVLVDFGAGDVLDHLGELGVDRVTDVLVTHHHRDQVQGLARAVEAGARIWVPPSEREFFDAIDERWRKRQIANDYDVREDRFSLLSPVPVTGTVAEYRTARYGAFDVYTLPTPGHTLGSVTYLAEIDGRRLAFTGDLVYGDGRAWSLAATQWTYSGVEGWSATIISNGVLAGRQPDILLPSHGEPIEDPPAALAKLTAGMQELSDLRLGQPWNIGERLRQPFDPITPHFLRNRTMFANNYALVSESGAALLIDFGYDLTTTAFSTERAARRTLLWSLDGLRRDHGVTRIDAAVMTHYHDDHVAGLNLLREVEGAEVWAPANVAPIVEEPERFDLPCLWFDPIPVDRTLVLEEAVRWHEYELTAYALPGHTRYAAAIGFEVDGKRILATGDQQTNDGERAVLNYEYRNRFAPDDFVRSAELYRRLRPDLIVSGHWLPREVTEEYLDQLLADGRRTLELHRELLPEEGFGTDGFGARIEPYRSSTAPGGTVELEVTVRNPFPRVETARVRLVVPEGWTAEPEEHEVELEAKGEGVVGFHLTAGARGGLVAADLTVGDSAFGQQAEALLEIL
jgi:glyoxylase-like metal-dependent hydrolase (beta-lactamase superfamily II)